MKTVIMEICGNTAVGLRDDGSFVRLRQRGYAVGQTVEMGRQAGVIRLAAACAAAVALLCGGTAAAVRLPYSYVTLDVNPSIKYTLNIFNRVLAISAVNEDAKTVVSAVEEGRTAYAKLDDAIEMTLAQCKTEGFLSPDEEEEDYVVLAVTSRSEGKTESLSHKLDALEYDEGNLSAKVVPTTIPQMEEAEQMGTTPGKLTIIGEMQETTGDTGTPDKWIDVPVRDIMWAAGYGKYKDNDRDGEGRKGTQKDDDEDGKSEGKGSFGWQTPSNLWQPQTGANAWFYPGWQENPADKGQEEQTLTAPWWPAYGATQGQGWSSGQGQNKDTDKDTDKEKDEEKAVTSPWWPAYGATQGQGWPYGQNQNKDNDKEKDEEKAVAGNDWPGYGATQTPGWSFSQSQNKDSGKKKDEEKAVTSPWWPAYGAAQTPGWSFGQNANKDSDEEKDKEKDEESTVTTPWWPAYGPVQGQGWPYGGNTNDKNTNTDGKGANKAPQGTEKGRDTDEDENEPDDKNGDQPRQSGTVTDAVPAMTPEQVEKAIAALGRADKKRLKTYIDAYEDAVEAEQAAAKNARKAKELSKYQDAVAQALAALLKAADDNGTPLVKAEQDDSQSGGWGQSGWNQSSGGWGQSGGSGDNAWGWQNSGASQGRDTSRSWHS
ncbi:MAG TPA: hypothetical protein VN446_00885 [Candidatus Acidoferrum sp.]|nr:hypothetical protein [Candidatus Acidoferrum sp.]